MNYQVLPIGFKADSGSGGWFYSNKEKYAGLILLVIALIFVICAVHFNSLRFPLAIIFMIPISFIGLFLAFGIGDFTFDKGGFAAFIMLSGITVNAGIYLVSEYLHTRPSGVSHPRPDTAVRTYIKAFDRKIVPISLTILSTILGLVPFLFDGPKEVFWFAFAIGTIAGMAFSILALILFLPVFALKKTVVDY
jgi:multidrug efflux pump subunit AcrB